MKKLTFSLALLILGMPAFSQGFSISGSAGISKDVRFFGSNEWNTGFCIGTDVFKGVNEKLFFGGHLMVHHWKVDVNSLADMVNEDNVTITGSSGQATVVEIFPSARFLAIRQEGFLAGIQVGAGLVYFAGKKGSISYSFQSAYSHGSGTLTLTPSNPYPWTGIGLNLGIPVIIGKYLQIMPAYCLYLANGAIPYNHISLSAGINLQTR